MSIEYLKFYIYIYYYLWMDYLSIPVMKKFALLLLCFLYYFSLMAQLTKTELKNLDVVIKNYNQKNFDFALQSIKSLQKENNHLYYQYWEAKILFQQGDWNSANSILLDIYQFADTSFSVEKPNSVPFDTYYILDDIYRRQLNITSCFEILKHAQKAAGSNIDLQHKILSESQLCQNYQEFEKTKTKTKIEIAHEYSSTNNEILFTSSADKSKLVYALEKIEDQVAKIEQKTSGMFLSGLPKDAIVSSISVDSRYLLFEFENDIFVTSWQKGFWKKSELMPNPINTTAIEKNAVFSVDNRIIVFSSNRAGGFGGFDLYMVAKKEDETWGEAINLGSEINSPYDEITPFLAADLNTLYFSSQGHKNMGGFDIFKSEMDENLHWQEAINMGVPLNSTSDDFQFWLHPNNADGFLISNRNAQESKADIYKFVIIPEKEEDNLALMIGTVSFDDEAPIDKVQISISDKETDELVGVFLPNKVSGKFLFLLPPEREYKALYEAQGYLSYVNYFSVPQDSAYYKIKKGIELEPVVFYNPPTLLLNNKTIIHDIFFETNSVEITNTYQNELDNLSTYLKKNPQAIISIQAHSDANSDEAYNLDLTNKRALAAKNYLTNKGVNSQQIEAVGLGESLPIANNATTEGQKYNRRIEFKIIKKGNQDIEIEPIFVPKNLRVK